jgi:5-methylcytosine-specific restriction endonuclease McrA
MGRPSGHVRRHKIADRTGWVCTYCKRKLVCSVCDPKRSDDPSRTLNGATLDHVVSKALRGSDGYANLVLACPPCNKLKGSLRLPEGATIEDIHFGRAWAKLDALLSNGVRNPMEYMKPKERQALISGGRSGSI